MIKKIPGFSNYQITSNGEVFSNLTNKYLKSPKTKSGYKHLALTNDWKESKYLYIHRLVALTYLNNPYNFKFINHKDCDKGNNNFDNLEWCTCRYNLQHASNKGLFKSQSINGIRFGKSRRKLNKTQLLELYSLKDKLSVKQLMNKYKLSSATVYRILNQQTYKELFNEDITLKIK